MTRCGGGVDKASSPREGSWRKQSMGSQRPVACCRVFVHVFHHTASATRAAQRRACVVRKRAGLVVSVPQCSKCRFCVAVFLWSLSGQKRETWWVRAPSHRVGIARDTRERGAQKVTRETNVTSEPTARPVRPGLGGRRWWNGWYGRWVLWRWSGPGLVTNGEGFGDLGRVDTKSTVRRGRSSAGIFRQLLSFCLSLFPRGTNN